MSTSLPAAQQFDPTLDSMHELFKEVNTFQKKQDHFLIQVLIDYKSQNPRINQAKLNQILTSSVKLDSSCLLPLLSHHLSPPSKVNEFLIHPVKKLDFSRNGPFYIEALCKPLSYSSLWTSKLMSLRNSERKSLGNHTEKLKMFAAEFALPLLTLSALVETATYSVLHFGAKILKPISHQPLNWIETKKIVDLKESSFFTISWTISMLYHNLFAPSLPVHESDARIFLIAMQPKLSN